MKKIVTLVVIGTILIFLIEFGPFLALGLWQQFNPNNYRTEEIQSKVKKALKEKYGEEFVIHKTEYNGGLNGFFSKAYPVNKRYLNFEAYVPGSGDMILEDYQIKKRVNRYLMNRFNTDEYYYEIHTGFGIGSGDITKNIKNNELKGLLITISTVGDTADIDDIVKKMDELVLELKNNEFSGFELTLLIVKKPYIMKKLENEIFDKGVDEFINNPQNTNKIAFSCHYQEGTNNQSFSSACKK